MKTISYIFWNILVIGVPIFLFLDVDKMEFLPTEGSGGYGYVLFILLICVKFARFEQQIEELRNNKNV
jgi:hypothetical protein